MTGIGLYELQALFGIPSDNPMYDVYPVTPAQAPALERALSQKLDLDQYDYFVESYAEPEQMMSPASPSDRPEPETRR